MGAESGEIMPNSYEAVKKVGITCLHASWPARRNAISLTGVTILGASRDRGAVEGGSPDFSPAFQPPPSPCPPGGGAVEVYTAVLVDRGLRRRNPNSPPCCHLGSRSQISELLTTRGRYRAAPCALQHFMASVSEPQAQRWGGQTTTLLFGC